MGMNEIISKDSLEVTKEKTRTGLWENHQCTGQGSRRGFSKESKPSLVSRKRTWSECYLGSQEESPKEERWARTFTVVD